MYRVARLVTAIFFIATFLAACAISASQEVCSDSDDKCVKAAAFKHAVRIKRQTDSYWKVPKEQGSGSVSLRVTVAPDGVVEAVVVEESSGSGVFDSSAVDAVRKASPLPMPADPKIVSLFKDIVLAFTAPQ